MKACIRDQQIKCWCSCAFQPVRETLFKDLFMKKNFWQ